MAVWQMLLHFVVYVLGLGGAMYFGYRLGLREGFIRGTDQAIEDLRKTVKQRAAKAQADADVLDAVARPVVRRAHIGGSSRRSVK